MNTPELKGAWYEKSCPLRKAGCKNEGRSGEMTRKRARDRAKKRSYKFKKAKGGEWRQERQRRSQAEGGGLKKADDNE
jgi:hypothetical protein